MGQRQLTTSQSPEQGGSVAAVQPSEGGAVGWPPTGPRRVAVRAGRGWLGRGWRVAGPAGGRVGSGSRWVCRRRWCACTAGPGRRASRSRPGLTQAPPDGGQLKIIIPAVDVETLLGDEGAADLQPFLVHVVPDLDHALNALQVERAASTPAGRQRRGWAARRRVGAGRRCGVGGRGYRAGSGGPRGCWGAWVGRKRPAALTPAMN